MHPPFLFVLRSNSMGRSVVGGEWSVPFLRRGPRFLGKAPVMLQAAWAALKGEGREHLCPRKPGWLGRAGRGIGRRERLGRSEGALKMVAA